MEKINERGDIELPPQTFQDISEFIINLDLGLSKHYLDDSLTLIWANEAFYHQLGYSEREFLLRFPDMKKYGSHKAYNFAPMIAHFQKEYESGKSSAEFQILMPIKHKKPLWMKAICTYIASESDERPVVYILYYNNNAHIKKQKELDDKEKESRMNLEWFMSQYTGNIYISDMETYDLLYLNENICETLHISGAQEIGQKCYKVVQGRDTPCPFCTNRQLEKGKVYRWEFYNPQLNQTFIKTDKMIDWNGHKAHIELAEPVNKFEKINAGKRTDGRALLESIEAGMVRINVTDHRSILWYNSRFLAMLGYTEAQFKEECFERCAYMHPEDFERASMMASDLHKTGDTAALKVRVYTRKKEERIWIITLYYVSGKDSWDRTASIYSMGLDITEEMKRTDISEHVVEKDSLTNILNRAETEKQIEAYIQNDSGKQGALFMIDTDDFKTINDTKGHIVGDMVLTEMAEGMKKIMREQDVVGRVGGDEFIIFMKDITCSKDAKKKADDLTKMIYHLFDEEKSSVSVSCSIGVSIYPKNGRNFKELYSNADKALYQVKKQGKNSYMLYEDIDFEQLLNANYFSVRTEIESEKDHENRANSLLSYVFKTLYESEDLEESINVILDSVGKLFNVSRAYIFENTMDNIYTSNTYEWCNEGITSEIENLQNLSFSEYGNYEQLFGEDSVFYCRDIHTLKSEQEDLFAMQGIRSTLQCAMLDDKVFTGLIGFDECTGLRLWTQEEVDLLILISQMISIFLQKKKTSIVKCNNRKYLDILDSLDECIGVIEKETDLLLYKNSKFDEQYPDSVLGEKYYMDSASPRKMFILWEGKEACLYCMSCRAPER